MEEMLLRLADIVCMPFALLLKGIGVLTLPISGLIFRHWYMKLLLAVVLIAISHRFKFDKHGNKTMLDDINEEVKLSIYPRCIWVLNPPVRLYTLELWRCPGSIF